MAEPDFTLEFISVLSTMSNRLQLLSLGQRRRNLVQQGAASSGYGHSAHSGYGHSSSGHGGYSHGYGGYSHGGYDDCCPLVFDPLTYTALMSFIALATYFLWVAVTMNIMGRKRKKRSESDQIFEEILDELFAGESCTSILSKYCYFR